MTRGLFLLVALLVASPAAANDWILGREFSSGVSGIPAGAIAVGNDVLFTVQSGATTEGFAFPIPVLPSCCKASDNFRIDEANAATYGLSWAALEAVMLGPQTKTVTFGPEGFTYSVPYLLSKTNGQQFPGYLTAVDLASIDVVFGQASATRWGSVYIEVRGLSTIAAPEPGAFVLLLVGCAHLLMVRSRCVA